MKPELASENKGFCSGSTIAACCSASAIIALPTVPGANPGFPLCWTLSCMELLSLQPACHLLAGPSPPRTQDRLLSHVGGEACQGSAFPSPPCASRRDLCPKHGTANGQAFAFAYPVPAALQSWAPADAACKSQRGRGTTQGPQQKTVGQAHV